MCSIIHKTLPVTQETDTFITPRLTLKHNPFEECKTNPKPWISWVTFTGTLNLRVWAGNTVEYTGYKHWGLIYAISNVISIRMVKSPANVAIRLSATLPPHSRTRFVSLATMPSLSGPEAVTTDCWIAVLSRKWTTHTILSRVALVLSPSHLRDSLRAHSTNITLSSWKNIPKSKNKKCQLNIEWTIKRRWHIRAPFIQVAESTYVANCESMVYGISMVSMHMQ
jgi:hypothetical protein